MGGIPFCLEQAMLLTQFDDSDGPVLAACDSRCDKAWGVSGRRGPDTAIEFSPGINDDDIAYLADHETGTAPMDPGTYEGGFAKPSNPTRHNKWCVRECERCTMIKPWQPIAVLDFSKRIYNQPWLHPEEVDNALRDTGTIFAPTTMPAG